MNPTPRILIADDEATFLNSTADLLRKEGYAVQTAANAADAMDMLRAGPFDLLIADINMPGNPALEFIRQLRGISEALPVILVTGYPSVPTAVQAVELSVVSYLIKPFELSALLQHVQESVRRSAIVKAIRCARERLRTSLSDMNAAETLLTKGTPLSAAAASENVLVLTMDQLLESMLNLKQLFSELSDGSDSAVTAPPPERPITHSLLDAIKESIIVLERTKGSFKSRELKALREKLEVVVRQADEKSYGL